MPRSRRTLPEPSPGAARRGSLRAELLFSLAFLGVAGLVLGVSTATVLRLVGTPTAPVLAGMLLVDVAVFVLLGRYLIDRHVVRPIESAVEAAQAIAAGDYARRAVPGETREMEALAHALNRMTDQLLENQSRLADNVRSLDETNRALHATQRDLVQAEKLASIGRLAAGVAHEIGNPLGSLLGYAGVLSRRGADPELVQGLEREARRIDRIVRRLLDYARAAPARLEPVSVNQALLRVVELFRAQGRMEVVEVDLSLAPEDPAVQAEPHLLEQVFVNLLDNACAAMPEGGRISVSTAVEAFGPDRAVATRRADDPPGVSYAHLRRTGALTAPDGAAIEPGTRVVRVQVADSGSGILPEHLPEVFDPFFTTRPAGKGTGLGLAIVASTVAEFGGRVEASSRGDGGGALFTLYLPLIAEAA